jgi:glycosyltransferase involved in cell wall biosynthesis
MRLIGVLNRQRFKPFVVVPEEGLLTTRVRELGADVFIDPSISIVSRYTSHLATLFRFPISVARLLAIIRRAKIDLVHTNVGVAFSPGFAARLARLPHVWHVRESFEEFKGALWTIYSNYMQMMSDRILCVSNATAAQFTDHRKVLVVHNGFPIDEFTVDHATLRAEARRQFGIGEADFVVGCVGRIKWVRKGQEYLIRAVHVLKMRGLCIKCLIVGSPYKDNESHLVRMKHLVEDLELQNQIVFVGEVQDPKPAYAAMDIFVLPSGQSEPFGGVVMEAMAMGLPVIATNIGGSLDQIDEGVTGFLVRPANSTDLADKIEALQCQPELRQKMGAAGKARIVNCFSLEGMLEKITNVYQELTST